MSAVPRVTVTWERKGLTMEEFYDKIVEGLVDHVLEDHRQTPDQFAGSGRHGKTPFHETGELIRGFEFKRAQAAARRAGEVGTIRAPASRFGSGQVRDRFVERLQQLWDTRGVGWSKGGL